MSARFRQTSEFDGVDESLGPPDAAIIVPLGGSNVVFLENGPDVDVRSAMPSSISAVEIKDITNDLLASFPNLKQSVAAFNNMKSSGAKRLYKITANALVGDKGVTVNAKNRKNGAIQAKLQAIALKPKPMTVAFRQIQVLAEGSETAVVNLSKGSINANDLLAHMN